MSNHTKGPWEVVRTDAGIIVRTESKKKTRAGASRYAAIGGFDRSDPEQLAEALANARLIAAAPKLLAALEAVLAAQSMEGHPRFGHTRSQSGTRAWEDATRRANALAIAVIAEATGDIKDENL
jgi:hypothetical protein